MKMSRIGLLVALALPLGAHALPMGSLGSWMVMGDSSPDGVKFAVNYAITRNDAWGAAAGRWEELLHTSERNDHTARRDFAGITYTRLLNRWNLPHAQANLWLVGMAGAVRPQQRLGNDALGAIMCLASSSPGSSGQRSNEPLGSVALLADYETTRLYTGGGVELKRGGGSIRHDTAYARVGFSFYEVEYEETQPWLIVEAKQERFRSATKNTVTPMLRFINKGYFVEVGGNREGVVVNFMLVY